MNPFLELYLYFFAYNVFSKNEPTLKELIHTYNMYLYYSFSIQGGAPGHIPPPYMMSAA